MASLNNNKTKQSRHVEQSARRHSKLIKRRAITLSPSPLQLPTPLSLELEQQAQLRVEFEYPQQSQAHTSPFFHPPLSPCYPEHHQRSPLREPQQKQLEPQLHDARTFTAINTREDITATTSGSSSPSHNLVGKDLTPLRTYHLPPPPSRIYSQDPKVQSRFNTLVRKASQLCQMSETEIYMSVRVGGYFYIYNSDDAASLSAPQPKAYDRVINVAVAGTQDGQMV